MRLPRLSGKTLGVMKRILAESPKLVLAHEFENVFVIDRETGSEHDAGEHYGDPVCGVIAGDQSWAASGGEGVVVWHRDGRREEFLRGLDTSVTERHLGPRYLAVIALSIHAEILFIEGEDSLSGELLAWSLDPVAGKLTEVTPNPTQSKDRR